MQKSTEDYDQVRMRMCMEQLNNPTFQARFGEETPFNKLAFGW